MSETPQTPPPPEPTPPGSGGTASGPAGGYDAPPPAGSTGTPGGATNTPAGGYNADHMKAAVQNTHQYDLGIIVLGLLAFIFSLIPSYYTADVPGLLSDNLNAWHGFWGWFGAVLALAGAALLAAEVLMNLAMPMPTRIVVLVLFGLGLLCTIIAGLTWAGYDTHGVDVGKYTGHGFSYWACLILILAGTVLAFLRTEYAGAVTGKKR